MNKKQIIATVAEEFELSKAKSGRILNKILDLVSNALKNGESVQFVGFGSFKVVNKAERNGFNPATKKKMKIPAQKTIKFKVSKKLKSSLNK